MTTLIPIHSAAMFHVVHVRSRMVVGARSLFHSGLADTSSRSSTKSRRSAVSSAFIVSVAIFLLKLEADDDARVDLDLADGERTRRGRGLAVRRAGRVEA